MRKASGPDKLTDALTNSVGYLLAQSSRLYREKLSAALAPVQLSVSEYVCLRLISFSQAIAQGDLGERYGIDRTTMVGLVDSLESRELVLRERNEADRRSYRLTLTARGRKLLSRALRLARSTQSTFLGPLSESEWELMKGCLWKLICHNER